MGTMLPGAAMAVLQSGLSAAQQQQAASQQAAARQSEVNAQLDQMRVANEIDARSRRERLKRALATQRARFGAAGLVEGGSVDAVLGGLGAEADRQQADANALASSQANRLLTQFASSNTRNLLSGSPQTYQVAFSALQRGLRNTSLLED